MKDIITNTKDEGSKDTVSSMNEVKIYERSPYSSFYVFIENNKNLLSKVEYAALEEHFKLLTEKPGIGFKPDLIIYLYTEPKTALKRLKQRGRLEEGNITLEFIEKIHRLHEEWLFENKRPVPAPVFTAYKEDWNPEKLVKKFD